MKFQLIITASLATACLAFAGCGQASDGLKRFPVSGTVTYQGQPIEQGKLVLVPSTNEPGAGPTQVIMIAEGHFDGESTPGRKRVEFYASWPNGKTIILEDGRKVPDTDTLPPSCNVSSKLELDIKPEPNVGLVWNLK